MIYPLHSNFVRLQRNITYVYHVHVQIELIKFNIETTMTHPFFLSKLLVSPICRKAAKA